MEFVVTASWWLMGANPAPTKIGGTRRNRGMILPIIELSGCRATRPSEFLDSKTERTSSVLVIIRLREPARIFLENATW
jgi:hypothetical protein